MKAYKINLSMYKGKIREAVSCAVQEKAFELGYKWSFGKEASYTKSPYLFLADKITHFGTEDALYDALYFEARSGTNISAADFLSLSQPDFKLFEKVLVRDFDDENWQIDFFEEEINTGYQCVKSFWHQCIPFIGNEHLHGTTGEPTIS